MDATPSLPNAPTDLGPTMLLRLRQSLQIAPKFSEERPLRVESHAQGDLLGAAKRNIGPRKNQDR